MFWLKHVLLQAELIFTLCLRMHCVFLVFLSPWDPSFQSPHWPPPSGSGLGLAALTVVIIFYTCLWWELGIFTLTKNTWLFWYLERAVFRSFCGITITVFISCISELHTQNKWEQALLLWEFIFLEICLVQYTTTQNISLLLWCFSWAS